MNAIDLYTERGELLDMKVFADMNERPFYLQDSLDSINEQIRLIENITEENQNFYFKSYTTLGKSNVTVSKEWRKHHLHQTAEQVADAKANEAMLKQIRANSELVTPAEKP